MTVDPGVVPGLLVLALELLALAAIGYVVARAALRQTDPLLALAQGLVIGMALWGITANFLLHAVPGRAGALLTWLLLLALSLGLGLRQRDELAIHRSKVLGFLAASLTAFALALAARQTLIVNDAFIRLGLAAPIQAGVWPPILPWSPWQPIPYHYGTDMLVGLLAPPAGPDLAFTKEILDAAAWTSLAVLLAVTVRKHGGWLSLLVLTPLLLTAGAWIQLQGTSPPLLQFLAPSGLPAPGLRASLAATYWPEIQWPWPFPEPHAAPPNIWFLRFTLAYALALTVLERVSTSRQPLTWQSAIILAALIGFLGLVEEAMALTTLGLWGFFELARFVRGQPTQRRMLAHPAAGLGLAALLLAAGGGVLTGMLSGATGGDSAFSLSADPSRLRPLAPVEALPGGLALLGVGPAVVAGITVLIGLRRRLALAFAAGAGVFLLAALMLGYESAPQNVARLDAHAGNFALFGLIIATAVRLRAARPSWRYPICAVLGAVVVWPSVVHPVRSMAFQVSHGIDLANAQPSAVPRTAASYAAGIGRQVIEQLTPNQAGSYLPDPPPPLHTRPIGALKDDRVIRYIRSHTSTDARVLSPHPSEMTLATGRSNAAGFAGHLHYVERVGPDFQDAIRFLEPAAVRRLGFSYLHATDAWISTLPDRAKGWLSDQRLFDPLVRDGNHALYRIQPAFLRMDPTPAPQSYEALRQAIPISATVLLTDGLERLNKLRLASVLANTRLTGTIDTSRIHLIPGIHVEAPGPRISDVVIVARDLILDHADHGLPTVWWDSKAIALATDPSIAQPIDPPSPAVPDFAVRLSAARPEMNHITFTATFTDHAPKGWTGQDWLVIQLSDSPWSWPIHYEDDGYTLIGKQWFAGQVGPSGRTEVHRYQFNALAGTMHVRNASGDLSPVLGSADDLTPGTWALAVRLRQGYLQSAVIPVLGIVVLESGHVSYTAYSGERGTTLNPCPERMWQTDACRNLATTSGAAPS